MSGLIDKDELKDRLKHGWMNDKFVLRTIDEMPIVDAVPVVRCTDCTHYNTHGCDDGFGWCERNGNGHGCVDEWFCADGKRREYDGQD